MIDGGGKATAGTAAGGRKPLRPGIAGACILFSTVIFLFILIGYRVQSREFYSGILITEFGIMLLPALVFTAISGVSFRGSLRLGPFRPVNIPIVIGIMIFAIPVAGLMNVLNLLLVDSIFGKVVVTSLPSAQNGTQFLVNLLVIAGSAGICEEVLFRGVIQRSFERIGTVPSILLAALLFSLTHLDFQKILGTFALGVLIGYIVYRTNSLYCGILAHFTNNAAAVAATFISEQMLKRFGDSGALPSETLGSGEIFDVFSTMPREVLIIVLAVYGFMFLFAAVILVLMIFLLTRANPVPREPAPITAALWGETRKHGEAKGLLYLLPGILLILAWFYVQANLFMGRQDFLTEAFLLLIGSA